MRFVVLVPKSIDPSVRASKMPVPDARPSEKIAKLFPQVDPAKSVAPAATGPAPSSTAQAAVIKPVPLPAARPNIKPVSEAPRHRYHRRYRYRP
jgi:membrane-bound lytic murein transglycosylase A